MDIKGVNGRLKSNLETYYYPNHIAIWKVTFRTIFATRKELVVTFGDAVTGNIGITDDVPNISSFEVDDRFLISTKIQSDDFYEKSKEALRKYFIYKRRVWKVPKIECDRVDFFFTPYQIEQRKNRFGNTKHYLYEPMSGAYEDLKKHKVIENFVIKKGAMGV